MGEIEVRRRTIPERLAYLAAKLRDGDGHREAVALALEVLADETAEAGGPTVSGAEIPAMKMVITLRSGVQIKADVEDFTTGAAPLSGELRNLKWTAAEQPQVKVNWLDVSEVVAVHAEYDWPAAGNGEQR